MCNHKYRRAPSAYNKQEGMTFIEVLVALVIIVTGILGAVAMQATAKQGSFDAMQRSIASSLAQDIIARMRAHAPSINPNLALEAYSVDTYGEGKFTEPENRCDTAVACTVAQMVANDMYEWELALMGKAVSNGVVGGLVGGWGCISGIDNAYTVVVSWQARTKTSDMGLGGSDCGAASDKRRQVVVEAFIF
mgnify:CR=1 FL=1